MADLGIGNLYDYNKNRVRLLSTLSKSKVNDAIEDLSTYISLTENKYYMLLCRERNDYTIFKTNQTISGNHHNATIAVDEIICSRGTLKEVTKDEEQNTYEFWIQNNDEVYMYLFFPCDIFVIDEVD